MKYIRNLSITMVLICAIVSLNLRVLAADDNTNGDAAVSNGCQTLDAASTYLGAKDITDNVQAAVIYETKSDTLMYAQNADAKMYPSSLVKILTVLLAVQKGDLQEVITVKQDVLDTVPYYAASAELIADEELSLSDLLYCMMVGSANDAAAVIATHISGSQEAFVQEMNSYAETVGCTSTQFVNVHGLHDEQQFTTARDMARIVADAVKNEDFLTYFSAVHYDVPATNKSDMRELSSGNFLMNVDNMQIYYDERVIGGRTGVTEDGLNCLASLAEWDTMQVVSIVMGSESTFAEDGNKLTYGSFKETSALLNAAFDGCKVVQILHEGQILKQCQVLNGKNDVTLGSLVSSYSVLPADVSAADLDYRILDSGTQLEAPITAGQKLSKVEVWYGNLCVGATDLVAMNSVFPTAAQQQNADDQTNNGDSNLAGIIILSIVFGAVILLLVLRFMRKILARLATKHSRRYRRNRRRSQ